MKYEILALVTLFSSTAFAQTPSNIKVTCQPVALHLDEQKLYLGAKSALSTTTEFNSTVVNSAGETISIDGLKAKVTKTALIDQFVQESFGWVHTKSKIKIFGVKFDVSADVEIGYEIQGDVGVPVKKVTSYVVCEESEKLEI